MYGLEILHQCGKKVKTKSQKVLGASFTFVEVSGKNWYMTFFPAILNRFNKELQLFKMLFDNILNLYAA